MKTSKSLLLQKRTVSKLSNHEMVGIKGGINPIYIAAGSLILTGIATVVIEYTVIQPLQQTQQPVTICPNNPNTQ